MLSGCFLRQSYYDATLFQMPAVYRKVRVRSLWEKYYSDAHGLIFVMDSADVGRFEEARLAFGEGRDTITLSLNVHWVIDR